MRISTKLATGLMGVGVLAVAYKLGVPTDTLTAAPATDGTTTSLTTDPAATPAATPQPTSSAAPSKAPNTSGSTSKPSASKPAATTDPAPAPAPKPVSTTVTKTGDAINYRFGTIQLSVTRDNSGAITAVGLVQAGATGGRSAAFASLKQAALDAQGSGFGNVSGATYTTEAFKQALDSAIAKLP